MNHHYIEEHNIADRYLLGKLLPQEQAQFEEHFMDCPECLDRLEVTEALRRGLHSVAAEEAAKSSSYAPARPLGWLAQLGRWRPATLLAGALVFLAVLPTVFFIRERRTRNELAQTQVASAGWQRQYAEERQTTEALDKNLRQLEQKLDQQHHQLDSQLKREQQTHARLVDDLSRLKQPQVNAPIFALHIDRSAEPSQAEPVNQIVVTRSSEWIVFSLEAEHQAEYETYRATLVSAADKRVLWKQSGLQPNPKGDFVISFPSNLFRAGQYLLTLEGLSPQGQASLVAPYRFRVTIKTRSKRSCPPNPSDHT